MRLIRFFASLACFCLVLGLLFTVIDVCSFDHSFYVKEFQDNDTSAATGMSSEDNLAASDVLLDYLRGKRDDIVYKAEVNGTVREVYDERETIHMKDVRALYQQAIALRNGLVAAGPECQHHDQPVSGEFLQRSRVPRHLLVLIDSRGIVGSDLSGEKEKQK